MMFSLVYWTAHRRAVVCRSIAAIGGGYVFASVTSILLARVLPLPRAEAVMIAVLLSFCSYTVAVIWVFAARTTLRAWIGLLLLSVLFAGVAWSIGPAGPA